MNNSSPVSLGFLLIGAILIPLGCETSEQGGGAETAPTTPAKATEEAQGSAVVSSFEPEEGFALLHLSDFEIYHGKPAEGKVVWTEEGGLLKCAGVPRGYLRSKREYENFTLRFDYRFPEIDEGSTVSDFAGNTGVLVYITGEDRLWPKCLEVQGKHPEMAHIKSNSREVTIEVHDDEQARESSRKMPGEWNKIEIVSKQGALISRLNGQEICTSQPSELTIGSLGLQAEDYAVEFRNLRIRVHE